MDKKTKISSVAKCDLVISSNSITLNATGVIKAIHFKHTSKIIFSNALGPGYMLTAKNKNVMLVALGGDIQGTILHYAGNDLKISDLDVVGEDTKLVKDINITYESTGNWQELESDWNTSSQYYKPLHGLSNIEEIKNTSIIANDDDVSARFSKPLDASLVHLYIHDKRYLGMFHVNLDTGFAYTGDKHTKASKLLSGTSSKDKINKELIKDFYEKLKPVIRLEGQLKNLGERLSENIDSTSTQQSSKQSPTGHSGSVYGSGPSGIGGG